MFNDKQTGDLCLSSMIISTCPSYINHLGNRENNIRISIDESNFLQVQLLYDSRRRVLETIHRKETDLQLRLHWFNNLCHENKKTTRHEGKDKNLRLWNICS